MKITDPVTVAVAQCTDEKKTGTHRAIDLYQASDLFNAQVRWASANADGCLIVSGKHGLLPPGREISDYDTSITEDSWRESTQEAVDQFFKSCQPGSWRMLDLAIEGEAKIPVPADFEIEFVLLCGEDYSQRVTPYMDYYDIVYSSPFDGLRYQERINAMVQEARKVENKTLSDYATG